MPRWSLAVASALVMHGAAGVVIWQTYSPVRPFLECVEKLPGGGFLAHFGYFLESEAPLERPRGTTNHLAGAAAEDDALLPVRFLPGRSEPFPKAAFKVHAEGGALTWVVDAREATATRESFACPTGPKGQMAVPELMALRPLPPPEPPKVEPPPPEPPKREEPALDKPDPAQEPTRKPKAYADKQGQPKPKKEPKLLDVIPPRTLDMPLTLSKVSSGGQVGVQVWEEDHLGDPGVKANDANTNQELVDDPSRVPTKVGDGGGGAAGAAAPAPKIVEPRVKVRVKGEYPEGAPQLGHPVSVTLSLLIGASGKPTEVKVVKGAGEPFDSAARAVGLQLVFEPGSEGGVAKAMWVRWTVVFQPE